MCFKISCLFLWITWISHNYTYITSLVGLHPLHTCPPSRSSQSTRLASLNYTETSHHLFILHIMVYICQCYFNFWTQPPLPLLGPQVCFLILSLQSFPVNSFITIIFPDSIYVTIQYLFFSFWLTSLWITGSRFIHLTTIDLNQFFFMYE